jgi:hypothetical protein
MNTVWKWLPIVIGVFLAAFFLALPFFAGSGSMMGGGWSGWGMMGGWGFSPFAWIGMALMMIFMLLIPAGFLALIVFSLAWLVRNYGGGTNPASLGHTCPSCGRAVQPEWQNCPFCGALLKK